MAIFGKCLIEINETTRDLLKQEGAIPHIKSYDVVIVKTISKNKELTKLNDKLLTQNDELQNVIIKLATLNGESKP